MIYYYLLRSLRGLRNEPALALLMIAAVAVGIAGAMTTYTIYHAVAGDPIPAKSSRLYVPQIDIAGPEARDQPGEISTALSELTYKDATALTRAHWAPRQMASYPVRLSVIPAQVERHAFHAEGRAVTADFFAMFDVPFKAGSSWGGAEDSSRANVIVLSSKMADRLFNNAESAIGRSVDLNGSTYRVIGVLKPWALSMPIYDLIDDMIKNSEDIYLPFSTAVDRNLESEGIVGCISPTPSDFQSVLNGECMFVQYWVQLNTPAEVMHFRSMLNNYASEQQAMGRFKWPALTQIRNVRQWMDYLGVVPGILSVTVALSFGFLFVCLVNAVGLMLARFHVRADEFCVRRALGASIRDIFAQCLVESAVIGVAGGILGVGFTAFGLWCLRLVSSEEIARLEHMDANVVAITLLVAVVSTVCMGLYPALQGSRVAPALRLKET
jgi:putative ABC transport system permease protein